MAEDQILSDIARFDRICADIDPFIHSDSLHSGIGTYMEGPIHVALKRFLDPDENHYEIPLGKYIADIKNGDHIYEIQTSQFRRLKSKLAAFLDSAAVTVVYPMPVKRSLVWIDTESGECSEKHSARRLPKPSHLLAELAPIAEFVHRDNFNLLLAEIECVDYRLLDGWSKDRKRGSRRVSRAPVAMQRMRLFYSPNDYRELISDIPKQFTATELAAATKARSREAYAMIKAMLALKLAEENGSAGRAKKYILTD